jgi:FtsP/CotA-like multicopper oxidase with cupredoxin domain
MSPAQQKAYLVRYPYPNFTARFDFRDPNVVGAFVFHCHILAHEDQGMMAVIRVLP